MSIASEITRINNNIASAYSKVSEKGGTLPITQNSANLASSIDSIPAGSTGFPPDWTELGYTDTPQVIIDDFNYSKEVMQNWDASKTFNGDSKIAYVPTINVSEITDFSNFFDSAKRLLYIPNLDTSNGTIFLKMFYNCSALTSVPNLDTSNGTIFTYFLSGCSALTSVPNLDTSNGTIFNYFLNGCSAITSVPNLETSKGESFRQMFSNCSSLTSIPKLNLVKANTLQNMYQYCNNLTNESLNNILASLLTLTSFHGTKTLKHIGLSSSQATTCTTLSNWSALSQAGWTKGY